MSKKKLTAKLRQKIKTNFKKLKKSDFSGEALTYLNRVKGAAKARKIKADNTLIIDGVKIDKNTKAYQIAARTAKAKGTTIAKLPQYVKRSLGVNIIAKGKWKVNKEIDAVKESMKLVGGYHFLSAPNFTNPVKKFINDCVYRIVRFKNAAVSQAGIYNYLNINILFDAKGVITLPIPALSEFLPFAKLPEEKRMQAWWDLLDKYNYGYTPN